LRVSWRPVHQADWDEFQIVSPRDAALYSFPREFWSSPRRDGRLLLLGCVPTERVDDLPGQIDDADSIPPCEAPDFVTGRLRLAGLGLAARALGLRRLLQWLHDRPPSGVPRDIAAVLRSVKAWEGPRHTTACLPRAIARWWLLLNARERVALTIGVASPAARMHAWVTLQDVHIGEDPDEVAAYLPVVRYESVTARTGH
jgi:hypothetical protein